MTSIDCFVPVEPGSRNDKQNDLLLVASLGSMEVRGHSRILPMKLPGPLSHLFEKKPEGKEVFLSMIVDVRYVAVSAWQFNDRGNPHVLGYAIKPVVGDTWEDRTQAADRALGEVEEAIPSTIPLTKVILGFPAVYLTPGGEILKDIRGAVKKMTRVLTLEPIGFVPIHQAIIFKLKKDEGVPPSVILLHVSGKTIDVSVYKVGTLVGMREVENSKDAVHGIEAALKAFTELEVLPARMLLYDGGGEDLSTLQAELLKHPWSAKGNFLHFPKISIFQTPEVVSAVSHAGASELRSAMGEEPEEQAGTEQSAPAPVQPGEHVVAATPYETVVEEQSQAEESVLAEDMLDAAAEEDALEAVADATDTGEAIANVEQVPAMERTIEEAMADDALSGLPSKESADDNVVVVDPEALGFTRDADVLETVEQEPHELAEEVDEGEEDLEDEEEEKASPFAPIMALVSKIKLPQLGAARSLPVSMPAIPSVGRAGLIGGIAVFLLLVLGILYWFLPHASVTVYEVAHPIEKTLPIVIDPALQAIDSASGKIPGHTQEKSVSGEKTVPVTGKKNVGDAAHGTVTIYNKSLGSKTFRKGAVITTGSLSFTLDDDVAIASASESIGSITFGKGSVAVTAAQIGTQSNLAANTEFTFKDTSSSVAIARNDAAFTGGTSRSVTVVSRADMDAFVKAMTDELVANAKQQLSGSVGGAETLVDGTIKTQVTDKTFKQEIDQEATELSGKITITVTGISYSKTDVQTETAAQIAADVPAGYGLAPERTDVSLSNTTVKKDGTITARAAVKAAALPKLDAKEIQSRLAGKSLKDAEMYLRSVTGVGAVDVHFQWSPTKNSLPLNKNNIAITLSVQ